MKLHRGAVIMVSVGGYNDFVKAHDMSIIHAEGVISTLIVNILNEFSAPAKLNKLEGDAAMIFVPISSPRKEAKIIQKVTQEALYAFRAFKTSRKEISTADDCRCGSCPEDDALIDALRLKIIFHLGDVVVKEVLGRIELAGDTVIIAHRLMKNTVKVEEYLLMTQPYSDHVTRTFEGDLTYSTQMVDGYGSMEVATVEDKSLDKKIEDLPPKKISFFKRLLQEINIQHFFYKLRKKTKYA